MGTSRTTTASPAVPTLSLVVVQLTVQTPSSPAWPYQSTADRRESAAPAAVRLLLGQPHRRREHHARPPEPRRQGGRLLARAGHLAATRSRPAAPGRRTTRNGLVDFVPATGGTYFVEVPRAPAGDQFDLVVTRERGLRRRRLDQTAPQPLDSSGTVLGAITPGAGLFTLDDSSTTARSRSTRPTPTPAPSARPSPRPISSPNNPFGLNMAYDGTYLYVNNGAFFGDNTIYKIDPSTGAVIAQANPAPLRRVHGPGLPGRQSLRRRPLRRRLQDRSQHLDGHRSFYNLVSTR